MDDKQNYQQNFYQTGSTQPPKSHSGLVAALLVAVILLVGVVCLLGLMNIRLFAKLNGQTTGQLSASLQNSNVSSSVSPSVDPSGPQGEVDIELKAPPTNTDNIPQTGGLSLQEIYSSCIDSVVSISCQSESSTSTGTGVVLTADGYIVTNCHVVEDAQAIQVRLTDERSFAASLVGADAVSDLAVLYVEASDLSPAQFGDSDGLRVGDAVCAIGDPLGTELRGTMTDGIVSAINRNITTGGRTMTLIQTNAALNSGNSGGPLINCHGQVIGINTMKIADYVSEAGVEGLGFAIPSTTVAQIATQLIAQGYVSGRPSLGITGEAVSALYQHYYRLPAGVLITQLTEGGNAQAQGIRTGDILLSVNGTRVQSPEELTSVLNGLEIGDAATLVIYRSHKQHTVTVTVEEAKG